MKRLFAPEHVLRHRPTKIAKGMTNTAHRSSHPHTMPNGMVRPRITLSVRGTLDTLRGLSLLTQRKVCPCCKSKTGKLELNEHGLKRLAHIRNRRAWTVP